jgi:hypothetical protein
MAAPGGPGKTVQPAGSQGGSTAAQVTEETPDAQGEFPRLSEPQIAFLATMGERRPTRAGQVLVAEGSRSCDFYVILGGMVAVIEDSGHRRSACSASMAPAVSSASSACSAARPSPTASR